jgi:hypothetical protein
VGERAAAPPALLALLALVQRVEVAAEALLLHLVRAHEAEEAVLVEEAADGAVAEVVGAAALVVGPELHAEELLLHRIGPVVALGWLGPAQRLRPRRHGGLELVEGVRPVWWTKTIGW